MINWLVSEAYQHNEVNVVKHIFFLTKAAFKRDGDKTYYILSHLTILYDQFAS